MSDTPPSDLVTVGIANRVATLTLNNAAKRNALSAALLDALVAGLKSLDTQEVRVVILRAAAGLPVWSAGHDIKELPRGHEDPLGYSDPLEKALRAIRELPVPVIAMVHGTVWGGAFDLVLSCDMIVADETASFAITPVNLGLPYNTTGLMHFIGRLPMNLIKEMFFTAAPLKAADAEHWHIVNHLVPSAELEGFTRTLAEGMTAKAPLAVAVIKEQLRVLSDYQPIAAQVFERIQDMRRQVYESADFQEGIAAFLEKRKAVFRGT
ncbi:methylmalonyl-CoA decarboxylase [Ancylobacter oerskovii]|uniref:Methylmalonyl-CoA decarboxylase n=1 Tax=Ancylobacter oerskovii TaxID=459519 RepID=A0ABW4YXJ3_9HYPH|nr:methylmalonyl-CoA decarboxylase [Ancylobacter oerskovii]MBS7542147.1 methylmalonyl-CoA decarboxylase [Ancylobacter oerskovii]